jgi:hypothetical protein
MIFAGQLGDDLARVADVEGKIPRAIDSIAPLPDRDVIVVGAADTRRTRELADRGARVSVVSDITELRARAQGSADVVVGFWSAFRGPKQTELASAERVLRRDGQILAVHDYGRDDVSVLRGDQPEYGAWSRRDGPFMKAGFRIHVVHCWWTFATLDEAAAFVRRGFPERGETVAARLKRPRLSWNVAIYHRVNAGGAGGPPTIAA